MRRRGGRVALAGLLLSAALSACGARSQLRAGEAAAGGGSPAGTGGGGEGGEGGGGGEGGAGACPTLDLRLPIAELAGGEGWHQRQPALSFSSDDRSRATVASAWVVVESPGVPPSELRHTSLLPWTAWPASGEIAPSYLADLDGGVSFAASGSAGDRLALAFVRPGAGVWFSPAFLPGTGDVPGVWQVEPGFESVAFATRGAARHLVGMQRFGPVGSSGDAYEVQLRVVGESSSGVLIFHAGCAIEPMSAGAAPLGSGWMVAIANGTSFGDVACFNGGPIGPAVEIQVVLIGDQGEFAFGDKLSGGPSVAHLELAPRGNGAWLVWSRYSGGGPAPVEAARLGEEGEILLGPIAIGGPAAPFGVAELGGKLAVVWVDDVDPDLPALLEGVVLDEGGAQVATFGLSSEGPVLGAPRLLGSPDGRSLLMAWSEASLNGSGDRIRVARLDCSGG